jgi:zinc transport system substrate-binding protein
MAQADMVFYVGLGLETQVEAYLRDHPSKTRRDISFAQAIGISAATEAHDDHEHEEGHAHAGPDPHLWLDPALVERLIPKLKESVLAALKSAGAADAGPAAEAAATKLLTDVQALDTEGKDRLAPFAGRAIVTHHAAWSRFAEHFGLKVAAVIRPIETSEPTPETINKAVAAIREQNVTAIFVEPQFNAAAAERLSKEAGVKLGTLDPLGNGDWFKMMRDNVDAVVRVFGP